MKKILLPVLLGLISLSSYATHLIGGNIGYEYIGQFGSNYRYKIILTVYNNCDSTSMIPLPVATQNVGIYTQDVPNNPMGGGNKTLFTTVTLPLVDSSYVSPPTTSGCSVGGSVCIYKGVYEGTVDLPLNFNGYHLFFQNFARNNNIVNLNNPGGQGMAFHAYIPPNLVPNSSPVFADDPVPFLCVNDTVTLLNTAYDPDGDLLVFSFVEPFRGTDANNPPAPLPWTIPTVAYAGGYSMLFPFGSSGYASIDGATGLTQYMSPNTGNFVVAVEIREYRNGNLIGVSRRDLQLLVINCPPNPAPNLANTGGSGTTTYSITECDNLCFPITFTDLNGDSLTLATDGPIFDSTNVNPAASVDSLVYGDSTVTANFCWTPGCDASRPAPYLFTATATDNGCPPKSSSVVYQITVNPPDAPDTIFGNMVVCQYQTETYTVTQQSGYTYNWTVTGGTLNSGQGTNSINVTWNNVGTGTISVVGYSSCGCPSNITDTTVSILSSPTADAGNDTTICPGDTVTIGGSPTTQPGNAISWSPSGSLSNATSPNPDAFPSTTTSYIVTTSNGTCSNTDTVTVNVGGSTVIVSNDTTICSGDTIQLFAGGGVSYNWSPSASLNNPNISNPNAFPSTTTTYYVDVTDALGCVKSDSVTVTVINPPIASVSNDTTICAGDCVTLIASGGNSYTWTPASGLNTTSNDTVSACPSSTTTYQVIVGNGCFDTTQVTVSVNPLPVVSANNDTTICAGDTAQLQASGAASYSWIPASSLNNPNISNPLAFPNSTTSYIVTGTDANACSNSDTVVVTVNPLPNVFAGNDTAICIGDTAQLQASGATSYSWTPTSSLNNPNISNPLAFSNNTTTYIVTGTDANACSNSDTVVVTVNPLPVVTGNNDTTICAGDTAQLQASGATSYSWMPTSSLNNPNISNPLAFPNNTTTYIVSGTDANACSNSDTVVVTVNPLPVVTANNDTTICAGDTAQLQASGAASYSWTPASSLNNPNISNPLAFPNSTTAYIVTGTDANACSNSDTVVVTVNPLPNVFAGNDTAICIGDTAQLLASGANSYSWTPTSSLNNPNISNPLAFPNNTTTYIVTGTDANACSNSDTAVVTVNPLPVVTANNDTTICAGDTAQLQASGATFYSWMPTSSLNNPNISNPLAFPNSTTTYIVSGTDANACSNSDTVVVTVNPLPNVFAGNDTAICIGDTAQLQASGASSYSWTPTTSLNNPNISNPLAFPNSTTSYIVTGTDANSCTNSDTIQVTVNPLPNVSISGTNYLCPGDTMQLVASGAINYAWTPNSNISDTSVSSPMVFPTSTISYIVFGTDGNNCTSSDTFNITVSQTVPTEAGNDTAICSGNSVVLGGSPTAPVNSTYLWTPATGLNDPTLANPTATPTVTTTYYVVATNDTCTGIDSVTVTVNALTTLDAGQDTSICIGDTAQLQATGALTYSWNPSSTLNNSSIANPQAFTLSTTDYIVSAIDSNGCSNSDTVRVIVNPLPNVFAGNDTAICIGDTAQLQASGATSYSWTPASSLNNPNISNPLAFPNSTTNYIVTGTDANACSNSDTVVVTVNALPNVFAGNDTAICIGDTAQLQASGANSYSWTPTSSLNNPNISNPLAFPNNTTTYIVTGSDANACSTSDTVMVTVNPLPNVFAGNDTAICIGDTAQLQASGATSYSWMPTSSLNNPNISNPLAFPNSTTNYIVTGTDTNACSNMDTLIITVNPLPNIFAGNDTVSCKGGSVQLTATGGISYVWSPAADLSDNAIANPVASPDSTTVYTVVGTDANGCSNSDSVVVDIFYFIFDNDTTICFGDQIQLQVSNNMQSVNTAYNWSPGTLVNDSTIAAPTTLNTSTTTFTVFAYETALGCVDSSAITVTVEEVTQPDFDYTAVLACEGLEVSFINKTNNANFVTWDFGDGETSQEIDPVHTYAFNNNYTVILSTGVNSKCTTDTVKVIDVKSFDELFDIQISNVLTPNGDGKNDYFKVQIPGKVNECTQITIFNRWGEEVYSSDNYSTQWDGRTPSGKFVPAGTYYYIVDINGMDYKGSITVIR